MLGVVCSDRQAVGSVVDSGSQSRTILGSRGGSSLEAWPVSRQSQRLGKQHVSWDQSVSRTLFPHVCHFPPPLLHVWCPLWLCRVPLLPLDREPDIQAELKSRPVQDACPTQQFSHPDVSPAPGGVSLHFPRLSTQPRFSPVLVSRRWRSVWSIPTPCQAAPGTGAALAGMGEWQTTDWFAEPHRSPILATRAQSHALPHHSLE